MKPIYPSFPVPFTDTPTQTGPGNGRLGASSPHVAKSLYWRNSEKEYLCPTNRRKKN